MVGGGKREPDLLDQWLSGDGLATLDAIIGGAPDVIGVVDREYVIRYVNWATPGLTREAVIGDSVFNLVPPGYSEVAREACEKVLRTGVAAGFETMYRGEHGVLIWVVRVGPIRHRGEVIGLVTLNTDVTEQRRGEADRDRFFALSRDMLVVVTQDGRLKRVNPAFGEMLGYTVSELVGKPFIDFIHPDDRAATMAMFHSGYAGTPPDSFENRYRRRDGTYRVLAWRGAADPVTGDAYSVARDVTDQRATEAQLRHAQKMEAVGQLAGGIAHDFNNLMQAVLANVELALASGSPSPAVTDNLQEIAEAGLRAADLTKQLLVFSRRQPLHRVPININDLMLDLMKLLRRVLPENISIEPKPGTGLSTLSADKTQLEQVFLNLCVNARDAMENGGKLSLQTDEVTLDARDCELHPWVKPGQFLRLRVTDTGVGMTAEVRERVFDPFFTTKGQQRGTGLGLATVYAIVQQHGGLIHVHSEPGQGTTFTVYLPAAQQPSAAQRAGQEGAGVQPQGRETLLLAEDEELVRKPVVQYLERAGYHMLAAANGREAIELLGANIEAVDLVVLDVVMPELGGPETWERMRMMRPDLRVIFTSGYADDHYRERLPADAEVLAKPFRTDELLRRVRRKLDA